MVSEPIHPHGQQHQVYFECGRGHLYGALAPERIWTVPLPLPSPHRLAGRVEDQDRKLRAAPGSAAGVLAHVNGEQNGEDTSSRRGYIRGALASRMGRPGGFTPGSTGQGEGPGTGQAGKTEPTASQHAARPAAPTTSAS